MRHPNPAVRALRGLVATSLLAVTGACNDGTGSDPEPEISALRITVGAQVVTITEAGQQTGTLTIPRGTATVTIAWLRANGSVDPVVNNQDFEVRMVPQGSTGITFTPAGAFTGTLNATTAGSKTLRVQLFHLAEQHDEFAQNLTLTVT